jgi:hypothetical protein
MDSIKKDLFSLLFVQLNAYFLCRLFVLYVSNLLINKLVSYTINIAINEESRFQL